MRVITTATIGKGKAIHRYYPGASRTDCAAGGMGDAPATIVEGDVTCKTCLKIIAREVEHAHGLAIEMDGDRAENLEMARAEALKEEFERTHRPHWIADASGTWTQDGEQYVCDLPVRHGTFGHNGPCQDLAAGVQRHALTLTPKRRREDRRAERAKLRARGPQTRAAAQARRVRLGAARGTAKTLLVAVGVPQEVAQDYAAAFSRGVQEPRTRVRVRTGPHRSKAVEVKRYTWPVFAARLACYRPVDPAAARYFTAAALRVA